MRSLPVAPGGSTTEEDFDALAEVGCRSIHARGKYYWLGNLM